MLSIELACPKDRMPSYLPVVTHRATKDLICLKSRGLLGKDLKQTYSWDRQLKLWALEQF